MKNLSIIMSRDLTNYEILIEHPEITFSFQLKNIYKDENYRKIVYDLLMFDSDYIQCNEEVDQILEISDEKWLELTCLDSLKIKLKDILINEELKEKRAIFQISTINQDVKIYRGEIHHALAKYDDLIQFTPPIQFTQTETLAK